MTMQYYPRAQMEWAKCFGCIGVVYYCTIRRYDKVSISVCHRFNHECFLAEVLMCMVIVGEMSN
jgi:hypothetical protein